MERVPNPAAAINWYKAGINENASIYKIKDNIEYEFGWVFKYQEKYTPCYTDLLDNITW